MYGDTYRVTFKVIGDNMIRTADVHLYKDQANPADIASELVKQKNLPHEVDPYEVMSWSKIIGG